MIELEEPRNGDILKCFYQKHQQKLDNFLDAFTGELAYQRFYNQAWIAARFEIKATNHLSS